MGPGRVTRRQEARSGGVTWRQADVWAVLPRGHEGAYAGGGVGFNGDGVVAGGLHGAAPGGVEGVGFEGDAVSVAGDGVAVSGGMQGAASGGMEGVGVGVEGDAVAVAGAGAASGGMQGTGAVTVAVVRCVTRAR